MGGINVSFLSKGQTEYIQGRINKIRNSAEDGQSQIAWQTANKVSKMKSTSEAKLKAASQEERIHLWKQHLKMCLENPWKLRINLSRKLLVITSTSN